MNVAIPKSLQPLICRKIADGHYSSEDDVVADALRLMQARDAAAEIKRSRLKDAIERGYEDVQHGRLTILDSDDAIDRFFTDL
jgi:putative addiction module CopG family antidote